MTFGEWAGETADRIRTDGISGIRESTSELYLGGVRRLARLDYCPSHIWDQEWDMLVILDACRLDLMREVQDDFAFIDTVGRFTSVGSSTTEWLGKTFSKEFSSDIIKTAYVTGNPNSVVITEDRDAVSVDTEPGYIDEVWRYAWDADLGTVQPRPVTERAIATAREHSPERLIVHYMQPHHPFVGDDLDEGKNIVPDGERNVEVRDVWGRLSSGDVDATRVWRAYRKNLTYVLEDLEILLSNVDAGRTVITADHGNAVGEWRIYGHPRFTPMDCIVDVPWIETTATDEKTLDPTIKPEPTTKVTEHDVTERLRHLGYHQ